MTYTQILIDADQLGSFPNHFMKSIFFFFFFCSVSGVFVHSAMGNSADTIPDDQQMKAQRFHLQKLHQGMQQQHEKVIESEKLEKSILFELEESDKKIRIQQGNIQDMRQQIEEVVHDLEVKKQDLARILKVRNGIRKQLESRLQVLYIMGGTDVINVVFSAKTLPELVLFKDSFHSLIHYDRILIATYQKNIDRLHRSREAFKLQKALLTSVVSRLDEEKIKLESIHKEKNNLLHQIHTRGKLYAQALKEMKKAETGLVSTIKLFKKKQREGHRQSLHAKKKLKEKVNNKFLKQKSRLRPPVVGTLVYRFGEQQEGSLHGMAENGIIIKAPDESKVTAVFSGKVIFANYKRGYGNMVIIDHGNDYYTVTARLAEVLKAEGDKVKEGEIIGKTSDIATLFDDGVYFEVRHNSKALDPLSWLAPDSLLSKMVK